MHAPTTTSRRGSVRARLLATLFVAQVCGSTGHSISMAIGSIMAAAVTGTNTWSGLPIAVGALGTALASWPLARLMATQGRRRGGLTLGYGLGLLGAIAGLVGVAGGSFALMLIGMAFFGIGHTSNLLARYAAADVSPGALRGRAMGFIVWGSTVGSFIGPNLMTGALAVGALLGVSATASAFLISVVGYGVAAALTTIFLRPDPLTIARASEAAAPGAAAGPARSTSAILADGRVQVALAALSISQFVMISTTSTSPLYLHDHGHAVGTIGLAVALHLAGMYVASPLSGWLADRFGRMPVIAAGALLLIGAVALAGLAPATATGVVIFALALNGVGWNLAFVSASALLTDALSPAERASVQGGADLLMGLMGAIGSAVGGMILGIWGFATLNAVGAALVLVPLAVGLLRRPAPAPLASRG
jgi:MFS family permease